ncbi:MAG: hypothetical protein WCX71_03575 [Candidatus Buchananbacteria bacterium]
MSETREPSLTPTHEIEKKDPITVEEINSLIESTENKLGALDKRLDEFSEEEERIVSELTQNLIREKDRLQNIFTTEKGSIYFVLSNGASFRIKKLEKPAYIGHKSKYSLQMLSTKVLFIRPEEADFINRSVHSTMLAADMSGLIDKSVKTSKLEVGVHPLEIGKYYDNGEVDDESATVVVDKENGQINFRQDGEKIFQPVMHLGHIITEIVK